MGNRIVMDLSGDDQKTLLHGSQRICPASRTLQRVRPMMGDFGITRLANVTGLDRLSIPVFIAIRPNARSIAVSQGKGLTPDRAKASALMEAIEIWHAEHITAPTFFASKTDLQGAHEFVDLSRLPETPISTAIDHQRLHWIGANDLMSNRAKLVPLEMVHADYTHPVFPDAGQFPASTNGLASGNHLLEAICHGICEVIERDALALWHQTSPSNKRTARVDLDTLTDDDTRALLSRITDAGLACAIWDITSDIGVASFMCVIHEPSVSDAHLGLGSGTHPDAVVALTRSITEAAQTRLNYISGAREDLFSQEFTQQGRADKHMPFDGLLDAHPAPRKFDAVHSVQHRTLSQDLSWLKDKLSHTGIDEIAVVDLTRSEFAIPVVRVIIPGLEAPHDDAAYLPGPRAVALMEKTAE